MRQSLRESLIYKLRFLERYTRTDNVYLLKNGFFVFLNQMIAIVNGIGLYFIIGRYLPKEIYGEYKYLLSLFSLFSIATLTGMDSALINAVAKGYDASLYKAFKTKLFYGSLGSLAAIIAGVYYAIQQNANLAFGLFALAVFAPLINASSIYGAFFSAKKEFKRVAFFSSIGTLIAFCGMALAFIFIRNPAWLFVAFLGTSLVSIIGFIYAHRSVQNQKVDGTMTKYALHLSALDILGIIASNIDSVIAFHVLGSGALATYAIAIIPGDQLKGILKTVTSIALPKFASRSISQIHEGIRRKLLLFTLASVILIAVYIFAAPFLFRLLLPQYVTAVFYSQIYSLSIILAMPATMLSTLFVAKELKKELTQFNILSYSSQLILLFVGTWLYGLWGLIISRIISRAIMLLIGYVLLERRRVLTTPSA